VQKKDILETSIRLKEETSRGVRQLLASSWVGGVGRGEMNERTMVVYEKERRVGSLALRARRVNWHRGGGQVRTGLSRGEFVGGKRDKANLLRGYFGSDKESGKGGGIRLAKKTVGSARKKKEGRRRAKYAEKMSGETVRRKGGL